MKRVSILAATAAAFVMAGVGTAYAQAGAQQQVQQPERIEGKPNLRLLGQQSPDVVALELSQADVLVLPSYSENHPLVVLEAMAASVPVVAYAVGAVPHLLNPPSRGLTAAVGDTGALAAHLRSLCQDEERRMKMAQACYEYQTSLPDWKTAANHALHALQAQRP